MLDAVGSRTAVLFGLELRGAAAMRFAARIRTEQRALILHNAAARMIEWAEDYPDGYPASSAIDGTSIDDPEPRTQGPFDFLRAFAPTVADDAQFRAGGTERLSRSDARAFARAIGA